MEPNFVGSFGDPNREAIFSTSEKSSQIRIDHSMSKDYNRCHPIYYINDKDGQTDVMNDGRGNKTQTVEFRVLLSEDTDEKLLGFFLFPNSVCHQEWQPKASPTLYLEVPVDGRKYFVWYKSIILKNEIYLASFMPVYNTTKDVLNGQFTSEGDQVHLNLTSCGNQPIEVRKKTFILETEEETKRAMGISATFPKMKHTLDYLPRKTKVESKFIESEEKLQNCTTVEVCQRMMKEVEHSIATQLKAKLPEQQLDTTMYDWWMTALSTSDVRSTALIVGTFVPASLMILGLVDEDKLNGGGFRNTQPGRRVLEECVPEKKKKMKIPKETNVTTRARLLRA